MSLGEALREIVKQERIEPLPLTLTEQKEGSRCQPVLMKAKRGAASWALRLGDSDYLPLLAELPKEQSVRKLPDYLIFSEPEMQVESSREELLQVLICELKSSARGAEGAIPQVRLGKLLAEYLIRIALLRHGRSEDRKTAVSYPSGLIISPGFPKNLLPKGATKPGKIVPPNTYDKLSAMRIYEVPDGGELALDDFF